MEKLFLNYLKYIYPILFIIWLFGIPKKYLNAIICICWQEWMYVLNEYNSKRGCKFKLISIYVTMSVQGIKN